MATSERSARARLLGGGAVGRASRGAARLPLNEPTFAGNEWRYVRECLDSGWVSSAGPFVSRFERAVADYTGARHAVATVTGSAALHLALHVCGVGPGDEVLVPDLTFIAPLHVVRLCGAEPVLIDAHPDTYQMDPGAAADFLDNECVARGGQTIDRRTGRPVRALLPVHLLGLACEIDRFAELARRHRLALVEDAAQALGVRYRGRFAGTFGDCGVLSFNGNKIVTAGGGGMLLTNDARRAARVRRLIGAPSGFSRIGFNYGLTSLQSALGLAQLEQIESFLRRKRAVARRYAATARALPGVHPMPVPAHTEPSFWLYTIGVEPGTARRRDEILRRLTARGVGAQRLWRPMHAEPANRGARATSVAQASRLHARSICLPSGAGLGDDELALCIQALRAAAKR